MKRLQREAKFYSMTGYAVTEEEFYQQLLRIEIKTLNHRHLDVKVRTPRVFSALEMRIRQHLQSYLARGSIDCRIELNQNANALNPEYQANLGIAATYYESLRQMQQTLGISESLAIKDLLAFPDVITKKTAEDLEDKNEDELWALLEPRLTSTLIQVLTHRHEEGAKLLQALTHQHQAIKQSVELIKKRRKENQNQLKNRVEQKIQQLFESYPITGGESQAVQSLMETRLAQELSLLLDRTDVEEELVRLDGHLQKTSELLRESSPMGRKFEFLLQEMHREINTLGNKAQDSSISEEVVACKVALEQMREQVMNIE